MLGNMSYFLYIGLELLNKFLHKIGTALTACNQFVFYFRLLLKPIIITSMPIFFYKKISKLTNK